MKSLFILLTLFIISLLSSCVEPPLEHQPGWDWKIDRNAIQAGQEGFARAAADLCPTHGDDCYKRPPQAATFQSAYRSFVSFKSYYDINDAKSFFNEVNRPDWEQLFPNLRYKPDIVDLLKTGYYQTYLTPDSTIVVYTGTLNDPNYVFAIVPNLNIHQE